MNRRDVLKALGGLFGLAANPLAIGHLICLPEPGKLVYGNASQYLSVWRVVIAGEDIKKGLLLEWGEDNVARLSNGQCRGVSDADAKAGERFLAKIRGAITIRVM
jgi:hypothetical protein